MDPVTAALVGALVGAALVGGVLVVLRRARAAAAAPRPFPGPVERPGLPAGVEEVLQALRSGSVVLTHDGTVLRASPSVLRRGLVRDGRLTDPDLRAMVVTTTREGVTQEAELELRPSPFATTTLVLAVRVAPVGANLVLVLLDDRTQARRLEETRRDFVVNVSHELKTPVGGLALLAEAVTDAADDPVAVARFAGRMKTESARLTRLVSEIVDLSRLQTRSDVDDAVPVDVAGCAREAVEETRLVAGSRSVTATATAGRDEVAVLGDADLLTTAIRNLVTNAIHYSEDGSPVNVVTRRTGHLVEVAVSDQGRGISQTDQDRIFERFYRVDAARSRATGGTGLGLAIVKHICSNHGGDVVVWSRVGHGSTFTIRLPAADAPAALPQADPPTLTEVSR